MIAAREHFHPVKPIEATLPALHRVGTPRKARAFAKFLVLVFIVTPFALLFLPWQQTVQGRGRVIAYDPAQRAQFVTARVSGQIGKWYVKETDRVKKGQILVDMVDNDPLLLARLEQQRHEIERRRAALERRALARNRVIQAQEKARETAVEAQRASAEAAEKQLKVLDARLKAEKAVYDLAKLRYEMFAKLRMNPLGGLESELNEADARMQMLRSDANIENIRYEIERAKEMVLNAKSLVARVDADGQAQVEASQDTLQSILESIANTDRDLHEITIRIEKQKAQRVIAPTDGTIQRIDPSASQEGQYVKESQQLAVIVPDATDPYVELLIDGVDAPLIIRDPETGEYPMVRLQFEGWPALQFAGWPSVSIGTFGGRIMRIDPTDNGQGQFRVLVAPEKYFIDDDWPDKEFLRQGNQAIGWVMLRQVSLGYELWRRLNGFPPVVAPSEPKTSGKDDKVVKSPGKK